LGGVFAAAGLVFGSGSGFFGSGFLVSAIKTSFE
jgi:hypothetical protein